MLPQRSRSQVIIITNAINCCTAGWTSPPLLLRRERVRKEVFKGQDVKGAHRSGSEGAALAVIGYAVAAYMLYAADTNPFTGVLLGA
jgi:hypothetical protein